MKTVQKGDYEVSFDGNILWLEIRSKSGFQRININGLFLFFKEGFEDLHQFMKEPREKKKQSK